MMDNELSYIVTYVQFGFAEFKGRENGRERY